MLAGDIIKFYRQKAGLTQEELGKGICSVTHVSKIERGQSPYSSEIIQLFSERLHIDIEEEISRFQNLENQLHQWHKVIILQKMKEVEEIRKELSTIPFIEHSRHAPFYYLLQARYYMLKNDLNTTCALLTQVQREYPELPPYEKNMRRHVWGIYYILEYRYSKSEKNYQKAINILKEIDVDEYGNLECYYHLAASYQGMNSKVMAYVYAEKALRYFREIDHFSGAILAESIMLISMGDDTADDFKEVEAAYQKLIYNSELLNMPDKKSLLLNNLGYEYYRRKNYEKANKVLKEAIRFVAKPSVLYLQRWHNYLNNSLEGRVTRKADLLKKAREGLSMAKELDNRVYKLVFKLLIYRIEEKQDLYYRFLEEVALPYFDSTNSKSLMERYRKELYFQFMEMEQYEKAANISKLQYESI